jgi:hypothetical protein
MNSQTVPRMARNIKQLHTEEKKMNISFKAAAVLAVTAVFLAAPVFAPPVYAQSSPTNTATAGVFTTDVEDSMDVHSWTGVEFDKWTGFAGYGGSNNPISLGYATRFGDLYLGAWYTGNIASTSNKEERSIVSAYSLTNQLLTGKTTTITYTDQNTYSYNRLNVLIGVAGMGIKVGFAESLTVWSYPDITKTVVEDANGANKTYTNDYVVDDYQRISGSLTPSIEWGMSLEAGDLTIKPKVGITFGIYRDTNIYNVRGTASGYTYSTANGEVVGTERINYSTGTINDSLRPSFRVGADIDLSPEVTVGLTYGLGFTAYSNNYDSAGFSGTAQGTVNLTGYTTTASSLASTTTTTYGSLSITEPTSWSHSITPSFYYGKEIADGLELGFLAQLPITIGVSSSSPSTETKTTTKTVYNNAVQKPLGSTVETSTVSNNGTSSEGTSFSIGLNAAVGASYALVPGRFTVNAGVGLVPFRYSGSTTKQTRESNTATTTTKTYDADGKLVSTVVSLSGTGTENTDTTYDRVYASNSWDAFYAYAAGGFTFNFNENAAIDMAVNSYGSDYFTLNLNSVRVLFSFKF